MGRDNLKREEGRSRLDGHRNERVDDFNEVDVGSKDGAEVGDVVAAGEGEIGSELGTVGVVNRGVGVRGPEVEATSFHVAYSVSVVGGVGVQSAESEKGLSVLEPVPAGGGRHARKRGEDSGVVDRRGSIGFTGGGGELGEDNLRAVVEKRGSWLGGRRLGKEALADRREFSGGASVEFRGGKNIFVGDGGVSEERVLGGEGFIDVRVLNGGAIDFERFNDHTTEGGEVSSDGFGSENIKDEDARRGVNFIVKMDEVGVLREGGGSDSGGDEGPRECHRGDNGRGASESSYPYVLCSGRAGWFGFKESERRCAGIVIFGGQFACAREEDGVNGVRVAEPSGKSEGRVAMLEDVYSGCFRDNLRERLRHWNDGLDDRSEMIEDGLEFSKIIRGGREENVVGVEVGGLLEVGSLEIESC